jgi:ferritin-like metal-binding protein YciE
MKMQTLEDLFHHELKDIYSAEKQLTKALPKMAKAATHEELRAAFEEHLEVTETQLERIEGILDQLGVNARGAKCPAMEGLIEEGKELLEMDAEPDVLDAALICAAQRVEHYEIAAYGCARTFAQQLGYDDIAEVLQTTLEEEAEADEKLTQIAESRVNAEAMETAGAASSSGNSRSGNGRSKGRSNSGRKSRR